MPVAQTAEWKPEKACISKAIMEGEYVSAGRGGKLRIRERWTLKYSQSEPWRVGQLQCHSNVRVVRTTFTYSFRQGPGDAATKCEEVLPYKNSSDKGRLDLRIRVPIFGLVYLHVLAWWLLKGYRSKRFGGRWGKFRASTYQVDHGDDGLPHVVDWRFWVLRLGSGPKSNPSHGAASRWNNYRGHGGLQGVVSKQLLKKPRKRPASKRA